MVVNGYKYFQLFELYLLNAYQVSINLVQDHLTHEEQKQGERETEIDR